MTTLHDGHSSSEHDAPVSANASHEHLFAIVVLASAVFAAFAPSLSNGLVWDDLPNLVNNQSYRGLSMSSLHWMFTTTHGGHYQPLSWLSLAIDAETWGADTGFGFHLTNLVLHVINAVLLYFLTLRLCRLASGRVGRTGAELAALTAAMLFAIHPLRTESVAWATERRDVLSLLFLSLTVLLYLRGIGAQGRAHKIRLLSLSLLVYGCSLLSKATGMTLPVVLLILDYYPLRRVRGTDGDSVRTIVLEKLAFAVPAVVVALMALGAQSQAGALWTAAEHPFPLRIGQAFYGLMFYPITTLWPINLVPLYEQRPGASVADFAHVAGACFVLGVTVIAWAMRRQYPVLLATWFSYIVLVAPMLGLAQSGPQVVADRYSYVACIPFAILFGAAIGLLWHVWRNRKYWHRAVIVLALWPICLVLIFATRAQARIWKNPYTLWTATLYRAPDTPTAHANLAVHHYNKAQWELAHNHSLSALDRLPGNRSAHHTLALSSMQLGDYETAEAAFLRLIAMTKHLGEVDRSEISGLAKALCRQDRCTEAEELYRRQIKAEPKEAFWRIQLATQHREQGLPLQAIAEYERALQIDPTDWFPYVSIAKLHNELGNASTAVETLERGLDVISENVHLMTELGWILATTADDSIRDGHRALALMSQVRQTPYRLNIHAMETLAAVQAELGQFDQARATVTALRAVHGPRLKYLDEERARVEAAAEAYAAGRPMRD